jgi:hypothetical protein
METKAGEIIDSITGKMSPEQYALLRRVLQAPLFSK